MIDPQGAAKADKTSVNMKTVVKHRAKAFFIIISLWFQLLLQN
jgi:hypothetical protein